MIFNNHSNLEGQHAFLGASKYHWINYDETKVADAYSKFLATQRGTVLHDFACQCITLGQKLPKSQKTLNMYVNDAIIVRKTSKLFTTNCLTKLLHDTIPSRPEQTEKSKIIMRRFVPASRKRHSMRLFCKSAIRTICTQGATRVRLP